MTPHGPVFDTYLQVRLTTHDKERIKARALEAGLKTSEYVRKRALGEQLGAWRRAEGMPGHSGSEEPHMNSLLQRPERRKPL